MTRLSSGTQLGPYVIESPLGAGGMGEVYRARDTRLNRTVAIKTLPDHLSESPDLKTRFEREAKAISSLSHPHICTLYDIGTDKDVDYMVLELLEGETLSDRISRGPLPMGHVRRLGAQIAQALHAAHRRGVLHRDLKPGNIILTENGVKVLDFGLAKVGAESSRSSMQSMATVQVHEDPVSAVQTYEVVGSPRGTGLALLGLAAAEAVEGRSENAVAIAAAAEALSKRAGVVVDHPMDPGVLDRIEALKAGIPKGRLDGLVEQAEALSVADVLRMVGE